MEISKRLIEVLKNFSIINQSIYYNPEAHGDTIITKSVAGNIIASAQIEEKFPVEFAIFNLNEFLSALTMFDKPDLDFDTKFVTIRESGSKRGGLKFYFAAPNLIVYPKKKPATPTANFKFDISADALAKIEKSAKILNVEDLVLYGDNEGVHAIVTSKKNPTSNDFELTLSDEPMGEFEFAFKQSHWKFIPGNYEIILSVKESGDSQIGIGFFTSEDQTIKYGVAMERQAKG